VMHGSLWLTPVTVRNVGLLINGPSPLKVALWVDLVMNGVIFPFKWLHIVRVVIRVV